MTHLDPVAIGTVPVETIAKIAHSANRQWCIHNGDFSQVAWGNAPEWQKQSAIRGVHYLLANPEAGPEASHKSWMAEKLAAGWVHGPVKDPDASPPTHPSLIPYEELSPEERFKDRLFNAIVDAAR
jgi:hypothetical protein